MNFSRNNFCDIISSSCCAQLSYFIITYYLLLVQISLSSKHLDICKFPFFFLWFESSYLMNFYLTFNSNNYVIHVYSLTFHGEESLKQKRYIHPMKEKIQHIRNNMGTISSKVESILAKKQIIRRDTLDLEVCQRDRHYWTVC